MATELERLLRRVCDPNKDTDIPALVDRVIEIVLNTGVKVDETADTQEKK